MRWRVVLGVLRWAALCVAIPLTVTPRSAPPLALAANPIGSSALAPQVTVVVENRLPILTATGIAVDDAGTVAWVTAEVEDEGRLVRLDLANGDVVPVATSIVPNSGTRAYITQFGNEVTCAGKLSRIGIDVTAPDYLQVTDIVTGLCGPHDLNVHADERRFHVALVGDPPLIWVDLRDAAYLPLVQRAT